MAANSLPGVLQVSGKQRSLIDLKRWSHLATKLKALAHNKSEVDAQAQIYKNNIFWNQFGIFGLSWTWITPDEVQTAILCRF